MSDLNHQAQFEINCLELDQELEFFTQLGFKLHQVFPADNPRLMVLAGFGAVIRLEKGMPKKGLTVVLPDPKHSSETLYSPCGVAIKFHKQVNFVLDIPEQIETSVTQFDANESWVTGRAGMLYRDLIPDRLSGAIIASNIMIPEGGPVPDHVHFHSVYFQLIFCTHGWVKVVYEDQGDPFVLKAGDCVTQPPGIRHQVLEASDGLEVIEIGLPAEHMTTLDHSMKLPTGQHLPERVYLNGTAHKGQKFSYHQQSEANWKKIPNSGLLTCQTPVIADSGGLAAVNVIKAADDIELNVGNKLSLKHSGTLRFYYLMAGRATYQQTEQSNINLHERDSFMLPENQVIDLSQYSADFQCLEFIWFGG